MGSGSLPPKVENELKFPRYQGYFDKSAVVRWTIAVFFTLIVFFFLHFREVRIDILDLESTAPKYIVAQTDFSFPDVEATTIARQEAIRDVGKVYRLSDKDIRKQKQMLEDEWLKSETWREALPHTSLNDLFLGIELLQKSMMMARFTDPRTLSTFEKAGFRTLEFQIYTPISLQEPVSLPEYIWESFTQSAFAETDLPDSVSTYLIERFSSIPWKMEIDIPLERRLHARLQSQIPVQYTHVQAGDRIIDQGQKVTARHIAMLQAMKKALNEQRNLFSLSTLLGSLLLSSVMTFVCFSYLFYNHPQVLHSNRKLFLLMTIATVTMLLARGIELWILNARGNLAEWVHYPIFVPLAAILTCHLINPGVATFMSGFLTILLVITETIDRTGLIINFGVSLLAILETRTLRHRKDIFIVCAKAWAAAAIVLISVHLYSHSFWSSPMLIDLTSSALFMLFTAILVIGLLPLFESLFKVVTDVTLMEYMDPGNELLRRLSIEAPGTYQHSVVVGNLAEAAAIAIGANGLFCRVATLYHDIGKITTPQFFTENQQSGVNIHQLLTPQESAQVIIAHVSEGVGMGRKAGLPEQFIDIIKEHHGTSLVYYFFHEQLKQVGGDKKLVQESEFRYEGPKPRTKESAIIMIADSFEAASRSLENINEETLTELINRIIRMKLDDGQFDESLLTFQDLAIVKRALVQAMLTAGHVRVKYPKYESKTSEPLADIA